VHLERLSEASTEYVTTHAYQTATLSGLIRERLPTTVDYYYTIVSKDILEEFAGLGAAIHRI
jgi:NADPH-dependent curcumin reductase CurA